MISHHCSGKETEVPEVVGTLDQELMSLGHPMTFREFIFLNFVSFTSYLRD